MANIESFFAPVGQRRALAAYGKFATGRGWPPSEKMRLYTQSLLAFGPENGRSESERFDAFSEIYRSLASSEWQAFRPKKAAECWPSEKIFATLNTAFAGFRWGWVSLVNLSDKGRLNELAVGLDQIGGIKPKAGYPLMAVSKFLHFFNPTLFPIYDRAVAEKQVMAVFKEDFDGFCARESLDRKAVGAPFYVNYIRWAESLLRPNFTGVMNQFVLWLRDELTPKQRNALGERVIRGLYATAFEFTAIGAARHQSELNG